MYRISNKSYDENEANFGESSTTSVADAIVLLLFFRTFFAFLDTSKEGLWLAKTANVCVLITMVSTLSAFIYVGFRCSATVY